METEQRIPRHIAIIMDGNGRWAERHGVERIEGHRMGAVAVKKLIENLADTGVEYVTLYAFSTENWKRSKEEVDALMELLCEFIDANLSVMIEKGLRLMVTGRMWGLPEKSQEYLRLAIEKTASNRKGTLILALNYGGRAEIADTAKKIAQDVMNGKLSIENINEKTFAERMYLPEVPDPDLLIRTSGELRLSNFLLWELSYSEIYVTDTLWPDFDMEELRKAISAYGRRNRRFGGRK
ncbi:MAG: isoprenyl transferase [Victivallales bacterium]